MKKLRQMKKFLAEFMNRLPHFIKQSIDWYDGLDESIIFFLALFLAKTAVDLLDFVHYSVIHILVKLPLEYFMTIDQQNVGIDSLMTYILQQVFLLLHTTRLLNSLCSDP